MKRLRLLGLAAASTIACRASELTAPVDSRMVTGPHAMSDRAPVTDKFAAYISDAATSSVLVVGQTSHDTIAVIPVGDIPRASASSPDGARVYVVLSAVEQLAVIRTSDNTLLAKIPLGGSGAAGVVVSPDNQRVYVANRGRTLSVVNATTLQLLAPIAVTGISPFMLDVTPDGSHLYVGDNVGYWLAVVNTATRVVETYVGVGFQPWGVDVSDDGQFVYSANRDGSVAKVRTSTNVIDGTYGFPGTAMGVAAAPDNQHVFVAMHDANVLKVINVLTNQSATVALANAAFPKVTADGRWVYVTQPESGLITVLDAQTYAVAATIPVANPSGLSFASAAPPTQPTTTAITSSAQPSVTGATVLYTATVTSGGNPVTVGDVTFRLGGTACADAVAFAGPLSPDANGKATASRAFDASGSPFVVRACYDGTTSASKFQSSEGAVTQTVNPARVSLVAAVTASTQQYSDQVVLSAQLGLEAGALHGQTLTGVVTFSFGGLPVGTATVNATTLPITVSLSSPLTVGVPAGSYAVSAVLTSGNSNFVSGSATAATATIAAENAAVMPDPAFPTEVKVTTPFGTSGPITFAFTASEVSPETNADQSLARPGDLTRTSARAVFTPSGHGAPVTVACTGGSITGSGYGQTRPFTCASSGLRAENYQVALELIATFTGSYYAGSRVRAFRVYDPSAQTTALAQEIAALVENGTLNRGNGNALSSKLDAIVAKIARGDNNAAIGQLGAFVNQVMALKLPADICDRLTRAAQAIAADLAK